MYSNEPCATSASVSGLPAFFKKPRSSALIPLPVSYDHWYEPSGLISDCWRRIGIGSLPVNLSAVASATHATVNAFKINKKVIYLRP